MKKRKHLYDVLPALLRLTEDPPERPVRKWSGGKKVPEKGHREILDHGPDPDRWQARQRGAPQNQTEQDRRCQAHCGTHHRDCPALAQQSAQVGIIDSRIAVPRGYVRAQTVSKQAGQYKHNQPHVQRFFECFPKDNAGQIAESALLQGDSHLNGGIVNLHPVRHSVGHDQSENNFLCFC